MNNLNDKNMSDDLRGRPKDQEKAAAILEAASKHFVQNGMVRTTMQDIADEAGVSKLTVYNHFGTKDALFQKIIQNKCAMHMSKSLLETALEQKAKDGLYTLGMGFIGIIYNDEAIAMHRTIMGESRHDKSIAKLFYKSGPERVFEMVDAYLNHLQKNGECRFEDISRASEVFLSLFTGATHMKAVLETEKKPSGKKLENFTHENVDFFLRIFAI